MLILKLTIYINTSKRYIHVLKLSWRMVEILSSLHYKEKTGIED